jgi:hypothetical protein
MNTAKELKKAKKFLKSVETEVNPDLLDVFADSYNVDYSLESLHQIQLKMSEVSEMIRVFRKSITVENGKKK